MSHRPSFAASLLATLSVLAVSGRAAALQQPDGTVIPVGAGLQNLFNARGEAINAVSSAATTPETFVPGCALDFTVLQRNAGYQNAFGWYNVTGSAPQLSDLHEFLRCDDAVNTTKTLDIRNDPNYLGGEVGFYQGVISGCTPSSGPANYLYVFYSQPAYNPDSSQNNPFIHLLIYDSTVTPNAFYFGWEDLISGGDNDFDDLTTFVTGITCSGGGEPCDTGAQGVCAQGVLQCQGGELTCLPAVQPQAEQCDGFDNDCNGATDEGELCPVGEVCDQGNCVPKCGTGEFVCTSGKVCSPAGVCVDPACLAANCPEGTKCVAGECVGPCEGVVCPYGQVCQLGVCLDPCGPITCDQAQVCIGGVCTDKCQCTGCEGGNTCVESGLCVVPACVGVECPAGEHCDAGTGACVSDCTGAICPLGQTCDAGQCVELPGGEGGAGGSSGAGFTTGSGAGGGEGGSSSTGTAQGGAGAGGGNVIESGGCGCSVPGTGSPAERWLWLGAGALALAVLGRLRRRGPAR